MDPLYNKKNHELTKLDTLNASLSPLLIPRGHGFHHHQSTSPFRQYSNENFTNADSPLVRYLHSNSPVATGDAFSPPISGKFQHSGSNRIFTKRSALSPLSAVENLEAVDDDVLVMDAVLVGSIGAKGKVSRLSSANSGGGGSSSSSGKSTSYKMEICRAWEDIGRCRFDSSCQFAHGKEELYPTRNPFRTRSEVPKSFSNSGPGTFSPTGHLFQHGMTEAAAFTVQTPSTLIQRPASKSLTSIINHEHTGKMLTYGDTSNMHYLSPTSIIKYEHTEKIPNIFAETSKPHSTPNSMVKPEYATNIPITATMSEDISTILSFSPSSKVAFEYANASTTISQIASKKPCLSPISNITSESYSQPVTIPSRGDWRPQDDGIVLALPAQNFKFPSAESIDEYIQNALYGPSKKKRLPVFAEMCPD